MNVLLGGWNGFATIAEGDGKKDVPKKTVTAPVVAFSIGQVGKTTEKQSQTSCTECLTSCDPTLIL